MVFRVVELVGDRFSLSVRRSSGARRKVDEVEVSFSHQRKSFTISAFAIIDVVCSSIPSYCVSPI